MATVTAVTAVTAHGTHTMSKPNREMVRLLTGLGVDGDAHCGRTVQHRSRVARDPSQPNLRQVTGLRTPCRQLDGIQPGLLAAVLGRDAAGRTVRLAGVMAVVRADGDVRPGDPITVELPTGARRELEPV